jgi:hypothetical protein
MTTDIVGWNHELSLTNRWNHQPAKGKKQRAGSKTEDIGSLVDADIDW